MPQATQDHRVQLGCGTLIVIALIVLFFSRRDTSDLDREIGALRSEVAEIKRMIESQSAEIRQLREKPATASPSPVVEKVKP